MRVRYEVGPRVFEVEGDPQDVEGLDLALVPRWVRKMMEPMVVVEPSLLVEDEDEAEVSPF